MGVLQWFRKDKPAMNKQNRHRNYQQVYANSSSNAANASSSSVSSPNQDGTVRTPKYKQDLAEFQARRTSMSDDYQEIKEKKRSGRQSLPCTNCTSDPKGSPYERKVRSEQKSLKANNMVPNIQFLFRNQVFMPGTGMVEQRSFSERKHVRRKHRRRQSEGNNNTESLSCKQLNFNEEDEPTPLFFKNNYLHCDIKEFLRCAQAEKSIEASINTDKKDIGTQSLTLDNSPKMEEKLNDSSEVKVKEVLAELHSFDQWADEQLRTKTPQSNVSVESQGTDCSFQSVRIVQINEIDFHQTSSEAWRKGRWGCVQVQIQRLNDFTMTDLRKGLNTQFNILRKLRHPNIILLMGLFMNHDGIVHLICEKTIGSLYEILHLEGSLMSVQKSVKCALDVSSALLYLNMQSFFHTRLWSGAVMVTDNDLYKLAEFDSCVAYDKTDKCDLTVFSPGLRRSLKPKKEYQVEKRSVDYSNDANFRWHAPECFPSDESRVLYLSSKCDVYSLTCLLWECCNAMKPFEDKDYNTLKEMYIVKKEGMVLPHDGTYPGCLLEVFEKGFTLDPDDRIDLETIADRLQAVKTYLNDLDELIIPEILLKKKLISPRGNWNRKHSTSDSQLLTPDLNSESNRPDFEIDETFPPEYAAIPRLKFADSNGYGSNCSTPISKRNYRKVGTPGETMHKTDSTEYCTLMSPSYDEADESRKYKLGSSLTPKNYNSLKIKLPSLSNLDDIRSLSKKSGSRSGSYSFDIKNYSLPTTPIARNSKLLRNAWLSGDKKLDVLADDEDSPEKCDHQVDMKDEALSPMPASSPSSEGNHNISTQTYGSLVFQPTSPNKQCQEDCSVVTAQQATLPVLQKPATWTMDRATSRSEASMDHSKVPDESLLHVNVKPLVAIHERWISQANGSNLAKSQAVYRGAATAVKPASHCGPTTSPSAAPAAPQTQRTCVRTRSQTDLWTFNRETRQGNADNFIQTRNRIGRSLSFVAKDGNFDNSSWNKDKNALRPKEEQPLLKCDHNTSTSTIDEYVKQLVRNELDVIIHKLPEEGVGKEDLIERSTGCVVHKLISNGDCCGETNVKNTKTVTQAIIKGNKPLIQITIDKSGSENVVKILDSCVSVNVAGNEDKSDDGKNSLKRCQRFTSLQEARSTEDLYIDDELSSHLEETVAENMKLIPLHGTLHELLCDKESECCLIKVQQESGCDNVYFMCNSPRNHSHDTVDGKIRQISPVLLKRSISLIEETYKCMPIDKSSGNKSTGNIFEKRKANNRVENELKSSKSTPSLEHKDLPVHSIKAYDGDSSSEDDDFQYDNDDFEILEKRIDEIYSSSPNKSVLDKISEENDTNDDDNDLFDNDLSRKNLTQANDSLMKAIDERDRNSNVY